jgi:hypothetical protein
VKAGLADYGSQVEMSIVISEVRSGKAYLQGIGTGVS